MNKTTERSDLIEGDWETNANGDFGRQIFTYKLFSQPYNFLEMAHNSMFLKGVPIKAHQMFKSKVTTTAGGFFRIVAPLAYPNREIRYT